MSATAATTIVVVMMMLVITTLVATTLMVATTSAATAASASHMLDEVLDLLLGSLAVLGHLSAEQQRLACQRMVQVHLHLLVGHLNDTAVEVVAVLVLQGHHGSLVDVLVVEVSVDGED